MTTRVDFYQLSRDPVETVVAVLAGKVLESGARALVVSADAEARSRLSAALWGQDRSFLAHGEAGGPDDARQPILLSADADTGAAANGAAVAILADGRWREAAAGAFDRVLLLFEGEASAPARQLWRAMAARDDIDNRIFKQEPSGRWREGR